MQEYYANTGALRRAATEAKGEGAKDVGCSIVETFGKDAKPKELEEVLRLEYRSKLLNPKWAQVCAVSCAATPGLFQGMCVLYCCKLLNFKWAHVSACALLSALHTLGSLPRLPPP